MHAHRRAGQHQLVQGRRPGGRRSRRTPGRRRRPRSARLNSVGGQQHAPDERQSGRQGIRGTISSSTSPAATAVRCAGSTPPRPALDASSDDDRIRVVEPGATATRPTARRHRCADHEPAVDCSREHGARARPSTRLEHRAGADEGVAPIDDRLDDDVAVLDDPRPHGNAVADAGPVADPEKRRHRHDRTCRHGIRDRRVRRGAAGTAPSSGEPLSTGSGDRAQHQVQRPDPQIDAAPQSDICPGGVPGRAGHGPAAGQPPTAAPGTQLSRPRRCCSAPPMEISPSLTA